MSNPPKSKVIFYLIVVLACVAYLSMIQQGRLLPKIAAILEIQIILLLTQALRHSNLPFKNAIQVQTNLNFYSNSSVKLISCLDIFTQKKHITFMYIYVFYINVYLHVDENENLIIACVLCRCLLLTT